MPQLVVEKGNDRDRAIPVKPGDKIVVGRDIKANLRVEDVMTSRKHFAIISHKEDFYVKDLKSANGTFLNGKKVEQEKLSIGDRIQIGETVLSFLNEDEGKKKGGLVGKEIAGYLIEERLGRGAMGTVYLAKQISLDRNVALKILAPELLKDKSFVEMFIKEARACGKLNHPNIIQVYDVGSFKGVYYFSMEYVEKGGVADLLTNNRALPLHQALPMVRDACQALAYAERQGIIHRDIKPDNLFLNAENIVKIGDLGLAHSASEDVGAEGVFGTPHYIAPEQAMGEKLDHRADIYAMGCTFFRMVTGHTPYRGQNVQEILRKQVKAPPPYAAERPDDLPPDAPWTDVPRSVADIIYKMMAKNRDERYESASKILPELEAALASLSDRGSTRAPAVGLGGEHSSTTRLMDGSRRSNNLPIFIGIGVLVLLILIGAIAAMSNGPKPPDPNGTSNAPPPVNLELFNNNGRNNAVPTDTSNNASNSGNSGSNNAPPRNADPDEGDENGRRLRKLRQDWHEQMVADVEEILVRHNIAETGLSGPDPVAAATMDMLLLASKYEKEPPYNEVAITQDGTPVDSHLKKCARELESLYQRLSDLTASHTADYATCNRIADEAIKNEQYGVAIDAYMGFVRKYWHEFSAPVRALREWVKNNALNVDHYVEGFPGAVEVYAYPNGKLHQLVKTIGTRYDEMFAEVQTADAIFKDPAKATDYQARRAALIPARDAMARVVNTWKLPQDVKSPAGKVIAIQAAEDLRYLGACIDKVNSDEKQNALNAVANLRAETIGCLQRAHDAAVRYDFDTATKIMDDLTRSAVWEAAATDDTTLCRDIRNVTVSREPPGKLAQLRRAKFFMDTLIPKIAKDKPLILKPASCDNPDFRSASKVNITAITPAADGKQCTITLEYRGKQQADFPLASLSGQEFSDFVIDLMKLTDATANADWQLGAAAVMLERGEPGDSVKLIDLALKGATARKQEYTEYLAWALLLKAASLNAARNGTDAKAMLQRFRNECKNTEAFRLANLKPADRPLGR
ncbi:MAG: protein kinase [Planctomycetota bacterium]